MRGLARSAVGLFAAVALLGCGTARLPRWVEAETAGGAERAAEVLRRAVEAHGGAERWNEIESIEVSYEGEWARIGPRLQPVLSDTKYRKTSTEVVLPARRVIGQSHRGPAGSKRVYRTPNSIKVRYDGEESVDGDVLDAAALVADAYQLFLTAPFFFDRFASTPVPAGTDKIDGEICDRIAARVRPGFGRVDEDLAVLSVGRETGIVRRVRFTLNGTASTRGAEVAVTFRGHREIDGILWPTEYVERIRAPVKLAAHRWRLISLDVNGGADPRSP